jgi:hypothetical protein
MLPNKVLNFESFSVILADKDGINTHAYIQCTKYIGCVFNKWKKGDFSCAGKWCPGSKMGELVVQ